MKDEGWNRLNVKLDNIANIDVTAALTEACQLVEGDAKLIAPKDTGELARSITHDVSENEGIVYTNKEYAPYVEYGTGLFAVDGDGRKDVPWRYQDAEGNWHSTIGQKPQPYMHPALVNNVTNIQRIFEKHMKEAVND